MFAIIITIINNHICQTQYVYIYIYIYAYVYICIGGAVLEVSEHTVVDDVELELHVAHLNYNVSGILYYIVYAQLLYCGMWY